MVIQNSVDEKLLKLHSTVAVEMISVSYIRQFTVCVLLLKSNNSIALVATEPKKTETDIAASFNEIVQIK